MIHRMELLVAAALALTACGPSTPTPGPADAAPDVAPDAAPDVAADASPDAAPDAAPDATLDAALDAQADRTSPPPDATPDAPRPDGPAVDAPPACRGDAPSCVQGTAGGTCSDALTVARCDAGTWRCGAGEVFTTQCACLGRPPGSGCTCGPSGWVCRDAGAADVACTARPSSCVMGTPGGQCSDVVTEPTCVAGTWTCASGWIFTTQCACVGRPPGSGCTCGSSGWVCPDAGVADAGGGPGTLCESNASCRSGLLCCYPCGIPGCRNQCMEPMSGRCPLIP